ncbi:MAG TPA: helix-turn-helix domain-containing protein [Anaeromyxobacter sp.]|nr:helix-turn-helix domain-containing protein [Anaeromyxobacter sp.]
MARFYTTFEAARLLGVSLPTVVNWIKARRLKAHRTPGGHRRISEEDLAAFMLRHGMPVPPELSGAAPERRKALVVGTPGPAREGAVRLLSASGYATDQASPGFAAGAAAARFRPDVLVLQSEAPDGGEELRSVRLDRELSAIPVVGVGRAEWLDALRAAGCAVAISGPVGDGALPEAVAEALRSASPARGGARERRSAQPRRRRRTPASR